MTETTATTTRKPRAPKAAQTPAPAPAPAKAKTAADYRREIDRMLIELAGELVTKQVPPALRKDVAQMIANQLHHLTTKKEGWVGTLPKPQRSDWA